MSFSLNKSALSLLLLLACKGPQPQESSPLESDPQDSGLAPQGLFGVLEDGQGQRLGATEVLACSLSGCIQGETDAQGRFFFPLEPPAELALKTHEDLTLSPRRAAALEPCRLMQTARFDAGVLLAPSLPEGVPLAGDTVQCCLP